MDYDFGGVAVKKEQYNWSTFKGGGMLDTVVEPESREDLIRLAKANCQKRFVAGAMSNTLVSDCGYDGLVISTRRLRGIEIVGRRAYVGAGEPLQPLISKLDNLGFGGLEFLAGVPASVGGAVYQNAGAYGGELGELVVRVAMCDLITGQIYNLSADELDFGYRRTSIDSANQMIIGVELELCEDDPQSLNNLRQDYIAKRKASQPTQPSIGCTFKAANGISAGKLLDETGLKGKRIGDAQVSSLHANFIVNCGNATASEYIKLMQYARTEVYKEKGIYLQHEIVII